MPPPHLAIIGAGSAGVAAAVEAAGRGARVTLIEAGVLGGTCVNIGCVPSKIMIRAAEMTHRQAAPAMAGIGACAPQLDHALLWQQRQARVDELRAAKYEHVLKAQPNVTLVRGWARFLDAQTLEVDYGDRRQRLFADRVLVATGARAALPAIDGLRDTPFWTSTEALAARERPAHLIVIGGSAVGVELGQAFARLGSRVTLLEARDRLLPQEQAMVGTQLGRFFADDGIRIITNAGARAIHYDRQFSVDIGHETLVADRLLVATGRRPNTDELDLTAAGVRTDGRDRIVVDQHLRTSAPTVYAAGDCTDQPPLVYVAAAAGTAAARHLLGDDVARLDLHALPTVIFTDPPYATVGIDDATADRTGLATESRTLPAALVPRALANFDARGFIKLVAEKSSGVLLGAQILAPQAGEMIQPAVFAVRQRMTVQALATMWFPYLTMVEGIKLCAQTFSKDVNQLSCCAG